MAQFTPIGVTAMVQGHRQFQTDLASMGKSIKDTGGFAGSVKGQFLGLGDSVLGLGQKAAMVAAGGIAALGAGLTAIISTSVGVAARVSEMNRVIHFLGEEAGWSTDEVDDFTQQLVDMGIRLDVAQQVTAQVIRRDIDRAKALELVRVAQGAAIIADEDSSDTLWALMDAITTNNVLMLRRRGITVDATVAYEDYVRTQKGGTQATVDNSAAIADQTQKIDFLRREVQMAEDNYHAQNAELIHARDYWKEGSNEIQEFQTRVDKASLALDKKRVALAEAEEGLNQLKAAHGTVSDAIKVTTDDLSGEERSAAFLNAVLKDGQKLIPLYAEAMKEPSKRARSLKRHFFDLRVAIGKQFLEAFGTVIDTLTDLVKHMKITLAEGGLFNRFFQFLAGIVVKAVDALSRIVPTFKAFTNLVEAGTSPMRALAIAMANFIGPEATKNILPFMDSLDQLILKVGELFAAFATGGLGGVAEVLGFGEQFQAMSDMIAQAVAFVMEHFEAFKGALLGIGAILAGAGIAALIAGIAGAIAAIVSPIGLIIAAAALLGAAWAENWGGIRDVLTDVWENKLYPALQRLWEWLQINIPIAIQTAADFWKNTLRPALEGIWGFITETLIPKLVDLATWLSENIPVAIQTLSDFWNNTLLPALQTVADFWNNTLKPALVDLGTWLSENITAATQTLSDLWNNTLLPALQVVWAFFQDYILPVLSGVAEVIQAILSKQLEILAGLWQNVLLPALEVAWAFLQENIVPILGVTAGIVNQSLIPAFQGVADLINGEWIPAFETVTSLIAEGFKAQLDVVMPILRDLAEVVGPIIVDIFERLKSALGGASEGLSNLASKITDLQLPDWLTPGSMTPFEEGLIGIGTTVLETMLPAFMAFMTWLSEQWTIFQEAWTVGNELMVSMWTATMSTLTTALIQFVTVALAQLQLLLNKFNQIVAAIRQMIAALADAKAALEDFVSDAIRGDLDDLLDRIEDLADEFRALADAIREAAEAAESAGAGGGGGGPGLQRGGSFTVPSGVGPEGVPIRVHRLEHVTVTPAGQTVGGASNEYNFNLNVATRDTAAGVIQEFFIARALLAA